jgi:hypothetical protein
MQRVVPVGVPPIASAPPPEPVHEKTLETEAASETVQERQLSFDRMHTDEPGKGPGRTRAKARWRPQTADYKSVDKYGELQIVVLYDGKEVSADVSIDGQLIGPSPLYRPLKPGRHVISLERRPLEPVKVPVTVIDGKSVRMEIELVPLE